MKIRYFTKEMLVATAKAGEKRGYNRQLDAAELEKLGDEDTKFPIIFSMVHEHIAGEKVEPHVRVMVALDADEDSALMDMAMDAYNDLPEIEIPDKEPARSRSKGSSWPLTRSSHGHAKSTATRQRTGRNHVLPAREAETSQLDHLVYYTD